jgi:steroid 5-alpha reductase family enzyme
VLKSKIYPDRQWEQPTGFAYGLVIWIGLSTYWVAAWLLMWRGVRAPAWYLGMCVGLDTIGIFLHFVADMQKFTALNINPGHLVTGGLFSQVRNINYFGELLIYTGFGLLAMHWLPLVILLAWNVFVWLPNMRKKDRSLARYPEFAAYKERTKLYIPYLF